jgi:hypothetical protein
VSRHGCSFGFIGHSDAEDGKAESLGHRRRGWCQCVARSGSDNEWLGRALPCVYLGWSSGRDSKSGTSKSGVQGSGVDVGKSNDNDAEMVSGSTGAGNEANRGQ